MCYLLLVIKNVEYLFILFYTYECFACKYICATHMLGACGDHKRALDLELEFWMVVNYCVGARSQTQVLYKSNKCS